MMEVSLTGAEFYAYHGFYPEEQDLGGQFLVDITVGFTPAADMTEDRLANTVNYEQLYIIACEEMKNTRKLIETVAQAIADEIKLKFPFVEKIRVAVKKMSPPLKGKVAYSSVVISN